MGRLPYLATFGGSDSPSSAGRAGPDHWNSDGRYPAFWRSQWRTPSGVLRNGRLVLEEDPDAVLVGE